MELRDIIEKVSEMYRNERGKTIDLYDELRDIRRLLTQDNIGDKLLLAEYRQLIDRESDVLDEIHRIEAYAKGISDVRELLMDIGFDVKIERSKE